MGAGRCESCGADVPDGAAFCPRCGVPVGDAPVLPLLGSTSPAQGDTGAEGDVREDRPSRTVAGVVVAVVVVIVALSALSGGDGGTDEEAATTTSTTTPSTSTSRPPSPTTTQPGSRTPPIGPGLLAEGETMSPSYGTALVAVTEGRTTIVDLATGAEAVADPVPGQPAQLSWTGETLLALSSGSLYRWASDGSGAWEELDLAGWRPVWSGADGVVLASSITSPRQDGAPEAYIAVGASGGVDIWSAPAPGSISPFGPGGAVGLSGDDLVVSTFDGIFRLRQNGLAQRVAHGRALAVSGDLLLRYSCDDSLVCGLSLLDAATGQERPLSALPAGFEPVSGYMSPDGAGIMVAGFDPSSSANPLLTLVLVRDAWVDAGGGRDWRPEAVVWGPDASGAVWWNGSTFAVESIGLVGPRAGTTTALEIARRELLSGPGPATVAVVPLEALPERWRPTPVS